MPNVLLKTNEFAGKYVAMQSFEDHTVLAASPNADKAYYAAREKGCESPVILYVRGIRHGADTLSRRRRRGQSPDARGQSESGHTGERCETWFDRLTTGLRKKRSSC